MYYTIKISDNPMVENLFINRIMLGYIIKRLKPLSILKIKVHEEMPGAEISLSTEENILQLGLIEKERTIINYHLIINGMILTNEKGGETFNYEEVNGLLKYLCDEDVLQVFYFSKK
jgi:hypothetical protein